MRALVLALLTLSLACGSDRHEPPAPAASSAAEAEPADERCAECGMLVNIDPRWMTGWRDAPLDDGTTGPKRFDTPKCMFQHLRRHETDPARADAWATEYYSQERRPLAELRFVVGSDLIGPMGQDLAPVEPQHVERFIADHGGEALTLGAVDAAVLERVRH